MIIILKLGSVVIHKESGTYGTLEYSSFGYSIHTYGEYEGRLTFGKTLALSESEVNQFYDIVDLPEGYEIGEYGGVLKS